MLNTSFYYSRYHCCNIYTLADLNVQFQNQQHLFTLNCNKNWKRHQLILEFYLFNVQKQFLCLWCRLSSTTGKLHLSNYHIQYRGKGMTARQHLSGDTARACFWVLITEVSSHSKKHHSSQRKTPHKNPPCTKGRKPKGHYFGWSRRKP